MTTININVIPDSIRSIQQQAAGQPLRAFHGSPELRAYYDTRIQAHHDADEIIAGQYWEKTGGVMKGCAVGCSMHGDDHSAYEVEAGIPRVLARLEDSIFEALWKFDTARAKQWPLDFWRAPQLGADLNTVWPRFAHWLLVDAEYGVIQFAKTNQAKQSIQTVADLYQRWIGDDNPSRKEWDGASAAAYAYAADAADAAYAAAYAYAYAYADAAADAADAAADAADAAAREKWRTAQADKLLQLMREAV